MNLYNLKIGTRLNAGIGLLLVLMIILGSVGYLGLKKIDAATDAANRAMTNATLAHTWSKNLSIDAEMLNGYLRVSNEDAAEIKRVDDYNAQLVREDNIAAARLKKAMASAQGQQLLATLGNAMTAYRSVRDHLMEIRKNGKPEETAQLGSLIHEKFQPSLQACVDSINNLSAFARAHAEAAAKEAKDISTRNSRILIGVGVIAVVLGVLIGITLARSITRPIYHAVKIADTVAHGDLTQYIEADAQDETGILLRSLREMNDSLTKTVSEIRVGAETISSASSQIAAGNQDLSSRTEEQASSLEQTAASMEELASTVKQNADNARQANQLAANASEVAERGGAAVSEVVETMSAISASSNKISEIVSVIDGIAFQTNILALNAAVEAARAGEQGKGFAVVAGEVRTLAQRSANAAKEIKTLIEDSVRKVNIGSGQVQRAGTTMQEIVASVKHVTDIMGEITAASEEQARGIDQVNQAVSQMDEVTQQNAALVEESAAASSAMQDQAHDLMQSVSVFKIRAVKVLDITLGTKALEHRLALDGKAGRSIAAKPAPRLENTTGRSDPAITGDEAWETF